MHGSVVETAGFASYADEVRRGSRNAYAAHRIYDQHWKVEGKDAREVLRRATIILIETDPWFLATASPTFLSALGTRDLDRLTPFVGAGPAHRFAAFLRAVLWFHGRRGPHHPDRVGLAQLRRALVLLNRVPRDQRTPEWQEMVVGCYRALDYKKYKPAFAKLHEITEASWRASGLVGFLEVVAENKDWTTYDRYRVEWDRLPVGHHACECYSNTIHTLDGLRAAAAGSWDSIPASLEKAADVRGCPHLNSGGLRLDLAALPRSAGLRRAHELPVRWQGLDPPRHVGHPRDARPGRGLGSHDEVGARSGPRRHDQARS